MIDGVASRWRLALRCAVLLSLLMLHPNAAWPDGRQLTGAAPPPFESLFGGPFELIDHNGIRRTDRDFRGKFMLIFFGYTYCPDICPTNLQVMVQALGQLGPLGDDVQPIFISIDPARDTPTVLKDYVGHFGPRLLGLTGSEAQVRDVARVYRVHRRKVVPDWSKEGDDYLVDHSSLTHLIGPDGKFLTLFPHDTSAEEMARRLKHYLVPAGRG